MAERLTNEHHLFWPRDHYRTPLERAFRNLPCNKVRLDIKLHNLVHSCTKPPTKPSHDDMSEAVRRHHEKLCGCYEGKTPPSDPRLFDADL